MKLFSIFTIALLLVALAASCDKKGENPTENLTECQTRCNLGPDPGMCLAINTAYYYDKNEKKCKSFIWGGCGEVPFKTMKVCEACGCE